MKKLLSLLLAALLCCALPLGALAAEPEAAQSAADRLYGLELFRGTGVAADGSPIYELERVPNRNEAVTMLVRLLGAEDEALSGDWETPFTDLADWAAPYVGYAYENGLTTGVSSTAFGGDAPVTGAQYVTLVLRALGYSDREGDFSWDDPWGLAGELGLAETEPAGGFTRGDVAVVSAAALDVPLKGTETPLLSTIGPAGGEQDVLGGRELTDGEISALLGKSAAEMRAAIGTVADAQALLDARYPSLWMSYHMWLGENSGEFVLRSGAEVLSPESPAAGRTDIPAAMTYLLGDDCDIRGIYAFCYNNGELTIAAASCLVSGGKIHVFDPAEGVESAEGTDFGEGYILPEAEVSSLAEYADLARGGMDSLASLYSVGGGAEIKAEDEGYMTRILSPAVEPIYADESLREEAMGHIRAENIGKYDLSRELGGLTLSAEEAYALVDAEPQVVKERVKTAGDLLMYMLASQIQLCSDFSLTLPDGYTWHYNYTAREVMELKVANCGASANLANYLLEGDYEEIGFIEHAYEINGAGGHVYNYIKYGGKYCIVDFSSYLFNNYSVENEQRVMYLDTLEEYGGRFGELYGGVTLVLAHTSTGQHVPNVFGDESMGNNRYYVPEGAGVEVLYQSDSPRAYVFATTPLDVEAYRRLDWHKFW